MTEDQRLFDPLNNVETVDASQTILGDARARPVVFAQSFEWQQGNRDVGLTDEATSVGVTSRPAVLLEPEDDVQSTIGTPGAFGSGSRDHHGLVRQEPVSFTFKDPYYDGTARTLGVAETPSVFGADQTGASSPGDHRRGQPREGLTHASFFSGVGGLDLGLERAGWRTVSVSEIEPYACRVLELRFPGVPQLGSIVDLAARYGAAAGDLGADPAGALDGPGRGGAPDDRPQGADDRPGDGPDGRDDGAPGGPGDLEPVDGAEPDGSGEQRRAGRAVPDRRGAGADAEGPGADVRGEHDGAAGDDRQGGEPDGQPGRPAGDGRLAGAEPGEPAADDWTRAALWSGGFPCQDLSVAGKRTATTSG